MPGNATITIAEQRGFLRALARDVRGNTLAMMAMFLIPLTGLVGSAVDISRLYVVKARLQQACDAGALAGRKFMVDTNSATPLDATATAQAQAFFTNNFKKDTGGTPGYMNTTAVTFTPSKTTDSQVAGTASAAVPMTISKIMATAQLLPASSASVTLNVTCEARYDVADTDIMFVLDNTGSMACLPSDDDVTCSAYVNAAGTATYNRPSDGALSQGSGSVNSANDSVAGYPGSTAYYVPEKTNSRIAALRAAVTNFYSTVATNADPTTHVRYGFVTYTSTVNSGAAIMDMSSAYMVGGAGSGGATTVTYDSRWVSNQYQVSQTTAYDSTAQASCNTSVRTPSGSLTFDTSSRAVQVDKAWNAAQSGSNKCKVTTTTYGPIWTYGPLALNVSQYLTNASVDDPTKLDGTTNSWAGCIEERDTTPGVNSFNTNSLPGDLNPDLIPNSDATRWRPMWSEAIYNRNWNGGSPSPYSSTNNATGTSSSAGDTDNTAYYSNTNAFSPFYYGSGSLLKSGWITCGKPVRRLATMTQQDVTNYVNATDFRAIGGTYHDTGMIWGTRMLSPNGIFAGDTAAWSGRPSPNRVIVFLTDGDMAPNTSIYGMYGIEGLDKRVTNGDFANQKDYHNKRFLAECAKAKSLNIDVWTVMITTAATPTAELQNCATVTGQALVSSSGTGLNTAFQKIAAQVAQLRISK